MQRDMFCSERTVSFFNYNIGNSKAYSLCECIRNVPFFCLKRNLLTILKNSDGDALKLISCAANYGIRHIEANISK